MPWTLIPLFFGTSCIFIPPCRHFDSVMKHESLDWFSNIETPASPHSSEFWPEDSVEVFSTLTMQWTEYWEIFQSRPNLVLYIADLFCGYILLGSRRLLFFKECWYKRMMIRGRELLWSAQDTSYLLWPEGFDLYFPWRLSLSPAFGNLSNPE